jgi:hypothetical protein
MTTRTSPSPLPIDVPIPPRPAPRISGRASLLGLACALLLAGTASTCPAQGTIYYSYNNNTTIDLRAVSASGSNDRLVYKDISVSPRDGRSYGVQASCSHATHNGALTWVVTLDDDPSTGIEGTFTTLYQVTTGANGRTALVQLSDFDFANSRVAILSTIQGAAWAPDDSFLSFVLADFSGATPLVKIVRFPVADLVTNGGVLIDETNVETVLVAPSPRDDAFILQHSWSPDGTLLAYRNLYYTAETPDFGLTQLILREVATGAEQILVDEGVSGIRVDSFEYAPDGSRIAFEARGQRDIDTIAIPSRALKVVAAATTAKNGYVTRYIHPVWSPDSSGLAIDILQDTNWGTNDDVAKVPSAGGRVTGLTPSKTRTYGKAPRAWR